ncbi:MAG: helix-turn-helix domain-containing protein [Nanoarchaeota archaeon]|nr:helix-turn-helix domain-containing protein [Nanoarchaeota archaeon]
MCKTCSCKKTKKCNKKESLDYKPVIDWESIINDDSDYYVEDVKEVREDAVDELRESFNVFASLLEIGILDARKLWVTTSQAAKWFRVNDRTIRRWVESGKIKAQNVGNFQSKYLVEIDLQGSRWFGWD